MNEVRDELERVFEEAVRALPEVEAFAVESGENTRRRPDNFVLVKAGEAEHRGGGVYVTEVEVAVVVDMDQDDYEQVIRPLFRALVQWIERVDNPLRSFSDERCRIFGYHVVGQDQEIGGRQLKQAVQLRVGAAAL